VTREVKLHVVREVEAGNPPAQAAREAQVHLTLMRRWGKEHLQYAKRTFMGHGHLYKEEAKMAERERLLGQFTMANALLKKPGCGANPVARSRPAMEGADDRAEHDDASSPCHVTGDTSVSGLAAPARPRGQPHACGALDT
jgi:transposase